MVLWREKMNLHPHYFLSLLSWSSKYCMLFAKCNLF